MRTLNRITNTLILILLIGCVSPAIGASLLNGVATHSELGKEQFIAGLYTENLSNSARDVLLAQENKRIQIRVIAKRLSTRRFKRMWIEGMAINASPSELEKQAQNMANFSNMLKIKLTAGDIFTVDRADGVVTVSLNGATLGEINNTAFFDLLLRTWIGPVPLSSDFRSGLLTQGNIDENLLARYETTRPSDTRIAAIQKLIESRNPTGGSTQIKQKEALAVTVPAVNLPDATEVAPKVEPVVTAPATVGTEVAIAPPTPDLPKAEPPKLEPETKPEPVKEPAKPVAQPPAQVASIIDEELLDEELIEEEEDELEFTAESLLSQQLYIARLKKWTHKYLKYPRRAFALNREGSVRLNVTIDRSGKVRNVDIIEEAKYNSLTREARSAVKRASPFPPMPEDVKGDEFLFSLPIIFRIVDKG